MTGASGAADRAAWFAGFEQRRFAVNGVEIAARIGGTPGRPALLMLHGFPQSHVMWHRVAQQLVRDYFVVLPDLRAYGDSSKPPGAPDHANYSKRAMAQDMVAVMDALSAEADTSCFFLCGHDRGGRVAHRLALDHPHRVARLCVLDIAPTLDMYEGTSMTQPYMAFAQAYYHWFHLTQPAPFPETMIGGCAPDYLHGKLGGWGGDGSRFIEPQALAEYERCFCNPAGIHAACEDYRASIGIDLEHDRDSRARGQRVACDLLVLWGEQGVVNRLFQPLALWQPQCSGAVTGWTVPCGHYIPEQLPLETAEALATFFR